MSLQAGLSNGQQAIFMFVAFALPSVGVWFGLGAPTDHGALAMLGAGLVGGIIAFVKEALGSPAAPLAVGASVTVDGVVYVKQADGTLKPQ